MKEKAIEYLMQNPILHIGMIEPIRRGSADILYADFDGVLIKELKSKAYMISVTSYEKGQELLNLIPKCSLIAVHQKYMVEYILNKFKLTKRFECFQTVYTGKTKREIKEELEVKPLEENQIEVILEHYDKLSMDEIKELLRNKSLFGGYKEGNLIGFIGTHLEGSMGLLEIFPQYRRLGYGEVLESYMINLLIDKGLVPFAQIEVNNEKSIGLQKKLGFTISEDRLYWIF
ncbi:GNAT family N-acetyltransferase [Clostridium manihotivorum]|uniref:N-acetyltransferase n=1 Tax=Clostridium manihotivorum TaxID=2320868 RepID=A0A3R5UG77_9CLOT|nr:GNAT family N-acetyltransferase [Clostridium manihotivorum]QAA33015.1 N-acetyltransferase [Clostridium manihotivorum]